MTNYDQTTVLSHFAIDEIVREYLEKNNIKVRKVEWHYGPYGEEKRVDTGVNRIQIHCDTWVMKPSVQLPWYKRFWNWVRY